MDIQFSQASSRRSSKKRAYAAGDSDADAAEIQIRRSPRVVIPRKRRAIEVSDTGTPDDVSEARRNTSLLPQDSASATVPPRTSNSTAALSHDDPVPPDCCAVCLRRGGNYAYTCVYEPGSTACKRCLKERHKCKVATAEDIAKSEARCPQCKQRGLAHCWYDHGHSMCGPCIKWGKQCGAPTKRQFNANTRSFLGLSTPEPERPVRARLSQAAAKVRTQPASTSKLIQTETVTAPSPTNLPSQAYRLTRRSLTAQSDDLENAVGSVVTTLHHTKGPAKVEQINEHVSRRETTTRSRLSQVRSVSGERYSSRNSASYLVAPVESASSQGPRRTLKRNGDLVLPVTMQEATPEVSFENETTLSPAHVDTDDGEAADLQLTMEADKTGPLSSPTIEVRPRNSKTLLARRLSSVSSEEDMFSPQRHRVPVVVPQLSRPRRSQSRPSYVEHTMPDDSDGPSSNSNSEGEDDAWDSSGSEDETEVDDDEKPSALLRGSSDDEGLSDNEGFEDSESDVIEQKPALASRKRSRVSMTSTPKQGKGIDLGLPPLDNIDDIVADMATKAAKLGLCEVLELLNGRPINVATMCSGTESPILFLQMLDKALETKGLGSLPITHVFSAEIDTFKQAFIERNFHPPILFRDIRELGMNSATTATTAYGAQKPIPGGLHILIAGFVCKDLSLLNSKRKSMDDDGETGDTWRAVYHYARRFRPSIVLLENVKSDKKTWDGVVSKWDQIDYEAAWIYRDTKNYYIPHTRERMFMIAIDRNVYGDKASTIVAAWQSTMEKLKRQCSSPYEAFLSRLPVTMIDHSALSTEMDWHLCKLRNDQIRSEQELGTRRPITQWTESGTLHPPDHANRKWYESQSARVYDAIDVAHLLAAKEGHDSMSKMKIWDVSQNVDRFKAGGLGVVPCITPGGCDFASNRQDALNGSQTLVLQGMPLDKLYFAGETQRECQDLAGNAMTTTVIGASLISAIIHGYEGFLADTPRKDEISDSKMTSSSQHPCFHTNTMEEHEYPQAASDSLNIAQLLKEAKFSSRMCACEGDDQVSDKNIKICSGCGHTACVSCASNPRHQYSVNIPGDARSQTPAAFVQAWKPRLPARLKLNDLPDLQMVLSGDKAYLQRILEVGISSQYFCLSTFIRCDNGWRIVYSGEHARLVLSLGVRAQWLLYVDCYRESPGDCRLRKALETPVAQANIHDSLLVATWKLFIPSGQTHSLQVRESDEQCKSWRNVLGLKDHQTETMPMHIHVRSNAKEIEMLDGEYVHLPHCGTAEASLYKRWTEPALYLFLDPDPIGHSNEDSFVFSRDCSTKYWSESRTVIARVDSAWRPRHISDTGEYKISLTCPGSWETVMMNLTTSLLTPTASVMKPGSALTGSEVNCTTVVTITDVRIPEELRVRQFSDFSWALEKVRAAPLLQQWSPIDTQSTPGCVCSPSYPNTLWSVNEAGKATPYEERKAAATFERSIKMRWPIFQVLPTLGAGQTQIKVGINVASLVHRARGQLSRLVDSTGSIQYAWRLLTDHAEVSSMRMPAFRLRSNVGDAPYSGQLGLKHELRGAQPRALSWMRAQENGVELHLTEIEEAIHPDLGWRAEARAQTKVEIRGGVLADLPSFGKTVTTIALIQSEFEESTPEAILRQNQSAAEKSLPELFDTAATLIVCPPHLVKQWKEELTLFLGEEQYKNFGVCIVGNFAQLKKLKVRDIQQSQVVVVSWDVLFGNDYISELAWMASMPEPVNSSGRAFDAWIKGVSKVMPARISDYQSLGFSGFKQRTHDLFEQCLKQQEYQGTLPVRPQHGIKYQPYGAPKAGGEKKSGKSKPPPKRRRVEPSEDIIPLFHMFRFNRVVVDEYHYLHDPKKPKNVFAAVSVKSISGHKRWILSGTPALDSFTDIALIASFLGVRLGRFVVEAAKRTALEDLLINEQTAVERFLCKTEVFSQYWHQARHERAQQFLDLFVRQNEPSLGHIPCQEQLRAVDLDAAHRAVYLELSQHLISQRMQLKRLQNKANSDRDSRLNASLSGSNTAEDALVKAVLRYDTIEGEPGLENLSRERSEQRQEIADVISRVLRGLEGHKAKGFKGLKPTNLNKAETKDLPKLYASFTQDIEKNDCLGDPGATAEVRNLLKRAQENPSSGGLEKLKGMSKEKAIKEAKMVISSLRQSCIELSLRMRSERFIHSVQHLQESLQRGSQGSITCDAQDCQGKAQVSEMYLASQCGHLTCAHCMMAQDGDVNCVAKECSCTIQSVGLIKATDLGSESETTASRFGQKTDSIAELIQNLPNKDQGLVFAPNDETMKVLEEALDHHKIPYYTLRGCQGDQASVIIEEFKDSHDQNVKERPVVMLLDLTSEAAAGSNLTNANHIIFVSPLLVETQYKYDSAMTQAIARSRRYNQKKTVHIYHFAALRTVDVDILEHRHKRTNGITAGHSNIRMPPALPTRERTRLVKLHGSSVALVPISWMEDHESRKQLGIEEEPGRFASLINFSETFRDEEK